MRKILVNQGLKAVFITVFPISEKHKKHRHSKRMSGVNLFNGLKHFLDQN